MSLSAQTFLANQQDTFPRRIESPAAVFLSTVERTPDEVSTPSSTTAAAATRLSVPGTGGVIFFHPTTVLLIRKIYTVYVGRGGAVMRGAVWLTRATGGAKKDMRDLKN